MADVKEKHLSVPCHFSKKELSPDKNNEGFTKVVVYALAIGKNRNLSFLAKDEIDNAIPSLHYAPIIGKLYEKTGKDGEIVGYYFGGHDCVLTDDFKLRSITVPYGVVTNDETWYETVNEFGKDVEYLCCYAYLWTKRYPELLSAIYDDDLWFAQSAELSYEDYTLYEQDSRFVVFHNISFDGLCLLGKSDDPEYNTRPCFPNACVKPVDSGEADFSSQSTQFSQLMAEMKQEFSVCFENKDNSEEGGSNKLGKEQIEKLFSDAGITQDEVDFEISADMTEAQLQAAIREYACKKKQFEDETDTDDSDDDDETEDPIIDDDKPVKKTKKKSENSLKDNDAKFSATVNQKRDLLRNAMPNDSFKDSDGNYVGYLDYYVQDFDDKYVYVEQYKSMNGDYTSKNGRFAYSFDSANNTIVLTSDFEEMIVRWLTLAESKQLDADRDELEVLRKYKSEREFEAHKAAVDAVLSEFSDLDGCDEFSALKEKCYENSDLDAIKLQCFALRGMNVKPVKKDHVQPGVVKFSLDPDVHDEPPAYGGIFEKYGIEPVTK